MSRLALAAGCRMGEADDAGILASLMCDDEVSDLCRRKAPNAAALAFTAHERAVDMSADCAE